jgi:hypothetical protein
MKMSLNGMMSGLWRWLRLVIASGLLSACASKPVTVKEAASVKVASEAVASSDSSNASPFEVPSPDGKARVMVTKTAVLLQREPLGPTQELDALTEFDSAALWEEQMKEMAEGVRWSPRGTRVCIKRLYKRGSSVAVFSLDSQPAVEVDMDQTLSDLHGTPTERYGGEYRHGRFYYTTLSRWIDEDHMEINFSGNLVPKEGDDGTNWESYHGSVRVELGAKTGTVQGKPTCGELTD